MAAFFRGERGRALELLERAVEADRGSAHYREMSAYLHLDDGQRDKAIVRFRETTALDPVFKRQAIQNIANYLKTDPQRALFVRSALSSANLEIFHRRMAQITLLPKETTEPFSKLGMRKIELLLGARLISPDWLPITRDHTVVTNCMANGRGFYNQFPCQDQVITSLPNSPPSGSRRLILSGAWTATTTTG